MVDGVIFLTQNLMQFLTNNLYGLDHVQKYACIKLLSVVELTNLYHLSMERTVHVSW